MAKLKVSIDFRRQVDWLVAHVDLAREMSKLIRDADRAIATLPDDILGCGHDKDSTWPLTGELRHYFKRVLEKHTKLEEQQKEMRIGS